ncbi:MAG: hypothetical protein ABIQ90_01605 [Polaromonas sp.]
MKDFMLSVRFRTLRLIGVSGVVGLLLLMASALTGYLLIPGSDAQRAVLQQELSAARESATQTIEQRRNAPTAKSQIQNFSDWLPLLATNANDMQKFFSLAKEGGIELAKADYALTTEPGAQFVRYQVNVPVKNNYYAVLRFVGGALNSLPHLALEELRFARPQASSDVVEAQLRFSFFYRRQ